MCAQRNWLQVKCGTDLHTDISDLTHIHGQPTETDINYSVSYHLIILRNIQTQG